MKPPRPPSEASHLGWLFLQGCLFLPAVLPGPEWRNYGWAVLFPLFLLGWLSYCLVRNSVHLWRVPAREATKLNVVRLVVCGALFLLFSIGPVLDGQQPAETRLLGACWLLLGVFLVFLGVRAVTRLRRRTSTPADLAPAAPGV